MSNDDIFDAWQIVGIEALGGCKGNVLIHD